MGSATSVNFLTYNLPLKDNTKSTGNEYFSNNKKKGVTRRQNKWAPRDKNKNYININNNCRDKIKQNRETKEVGARARAHTQRI